MHLQEVSFDHVAKIFVQFYPLTTFCLSIKQSTFRNITREHFFQAHRFRA